MRPVRRGASPQEVDFDDYTRAKPELISRLGPYCSYCERHIPTNLAVEHIQPKKGPHACPTLTGRWENFLLACVNCNSTKGDKKVVLADTLLPDRDNTAAAYVYTEDGRVQVAPNLSPAVSSAAAATLRLVGLDKAPSAITDSNGKQVAIDRMSQRMQVWMTAQECKTSVDSDPKNQDLRNCIVRLAECTGFFSIWITVFAADIDMCRRLIEAFPSTPNSGCFNRRTGTIVTPAPNPDNLADGGKI